MAIFEIGDDKFRQVKRTTFEEAGLKERTDLQRLLRDQIEIVADGVLVIAEEFGEWTDGRRRIDLLGIDKDANLVVIELKRTERGGHMELQALRYAAMVSTLTATRAVEIFESYLTARDQDEDAEQMLLEFLEWPELDEERFGQDVRILLVSADFSRELTTAVMWLNEKDLDIRCTRIRPYTHDGKTLIDVQQVIPLPEAQTYQVEVREKKRVERDARKGARDTRPYDVEIESTIHRKLSKNKAILRVVQDLCRRGVSPEEIREALPPIRTKGVWACVEATDLDSDSFESEASAAATARGKNFEGKRWHSGDSDLIESGGKTYAFSNQWSLKTWKPCLEALRDRWPEMNLRWWPHEGNGPDESD